MKLPTNIVMTGEHTVHATDDVAIHHIVTLASEGIMTAVLYMNLDASGNLSWRGEVLTVSFCPTGGEWETIWSSDDSVADNRTYTEWDSNYVIRDLTVPENPDDPTYWDTGREDTYIILKLWGDLVDDFTTTIGNMLTIDVL